MAITRFGRLAARGPPELVARSVRLAFEYHHRGLLGLIKFSDEISTKAQNLPIFRAFANFETKRPENGSYASLRLSEADFLTEKERLAAELQALRKSAPVSETCQ